jgi:predicted membrane channel-forming protein YqfA (hemolysin III family)
MTVAALSVFGWVVVIGLVVVVIGTIVYWLRPKASPEALQEHELHEDEREKPVDSQRLRPF